jgi:FAD/FMN-containing dehydrogenase/Fe-S oxidoreductase
MSRNGGASDVAAIARELRSRVRGEVRFDDGSRALYATDASNYRQVPIGVVVPRDVDDVLQTLEVARRHGAPVLMRGGGTSLAGQCCNVAIVLDASKYFHEILEIDPARRRARVRPGIVLDTLRKATGAHRLTFGPDPATHSRCTLGGMLGNNSCGIHAVMAEFYGPGATTADQVEELEVVTYDGVRLRVGRTSEEEAEAIIRAGGRRGEIYRALRALRDRYADRIRARFPDIRRRVSGYNLPALLPENGFHVARALVGSEGTCVALLEATLTLIHDPPARTLVVVGYPSVYEAGDDVPEIRTHKPVGLEGVDHRLIEFMQRKGLHAEDAALLPEGRGWLFVEFGGDTREEAEERANGLVRALRERPHPPSVKVVADPAKQAKLWEVRESGLGATAFVPGHRDSWPGWEDSAVPVEQVGAYLRDLRTLFDRYGYDPSLYGHLGQGCIHCRVDFDLKTAAGIETFRRFTHDAAELVVRRGGSLSGEHGDGQARGDLLPIMFGEELMGAFREFKSIWDPQWRMNPGKLIDANPRTSELRLGTDYRPPAPATHFQFPEDGGSFAHAALRCVGVGKCRRHEGGTMCPSYMVTREEEHATRGRARLLFEMLNGDELGDGWRSEAVKEALDLCLACKGCKHDCPVNVDMATYKAEFLSHYWDGRLRPRSAYAFGLIPWWARLASWAPDVVNLLARTPGLAAIGKRLAGMAPERPIPRFAPRTFRALFRARGARGADGGRRVILWPDTFNDHFHPETAMAAVEVLEAAGCHVVVPDRHLCCGRPLYDYGMLDRAKAFLLDVLDALRAEIRAGVPVVGLEPSCVAVFRDEMRSLLPHDEDAQRLAAQTYLLSEYLVHVGWRPPRLERRAVVHGHCHHKSVLGFDAEKTLLTQLGLDHEVLDSGCCGMAGAFGFERGKYDVSVACGERVLLPAVRGAGDDELIVADGFSCRTQIEQLTGRRAVHVADVVAMALAGAQEVPERRPGESWIAAHAPRPRLSAAAGAALVLGTAAAAAGAYAWLGGGRHAA